MEILIHIEKRKLDIEYQHAIAEYIKRLSAFCNVRCICYKDLTKLSMKPSSACFVIQPGKETVSSETFAEEINHLALSGYSRIEYVIPASGHTDFLSGTQSPKVFSLSGFSMSEDLTAVVLTEQLYRAFTILNHITYHK